MKLPIFSEVQKQFMLHSMKERLMLQFFQEQQKEDFEIESLTKVEGKEKYDAIIISGKTKMFVEIKCRNTSFNQYNTTIIDNAKIHYLRGQCRQLMDETGEFMIPHLFIFHSDSKLAIYNVDEDELDGTTVRGRRGAGTTAGSNYNVDKEELHIPISNACVYSLDLTGVNFNFNTEVALNAMFPNNKFKWK